MSKLSQLRNIKKQEEEDINNILAASDSEEENFDEEIIKAEENLQDSLEIAKENEEIISSPDFNSISQQNTQSYNANVKDVDPASKLEEKIFLALQKNQKYFDFLKGSRNILYLNSNMLAEAYKIRSNQKQLDLNSYSSTEIQADLYRYLKLIDECSRRA